jgi:hypothetical protein
MHFIETRRMIWDLLCNFSPTLNSSVHPFHSINISPDGNMANSHQTGSATRQLLKATPEHLRDPTVYRYVFKPILCFVQCFNSLSCYFSMSSMSMLPNSAAHTEVKSHKRLLSRESRICWTESTKDFLGTTCHSCLKPLLIMVGL